MLAASRAPASAALTTAFHAREATVTAQLNNELVKARTDQRPPTKR
jgi:hypothetical protein